jgi:adenylate kinase family enzyme
LQPTIPKSDSLLSYFVWYRVQHDDRDTETAIRSMMSRLACRSGVSGRLLKKREEAGLWMEIYLDVTDAVIFERLLQQAVDEYDVEMFIDGKRCTECFLADAVIAASCG